MAEFEKEIIKEIDLPLLYELFINFVTLKNIVTNFFSEVQTIWTIIISKLT